MSTTRPYKLDRVAIRMVKEPPLYSAEPIRSPEDAVRVVAEMLRQYDREHRNTQCFDRTSQRDLKECCALQCECYDVVS